MRDGYKIGIVGATGAVGRELMSLLEKRSFPVAELRPLASAKSAGKTLIFQGENCTVQEARPENLGGLDYIFFSAGASRSQELAPVAVDQGAVVIDNSSAFRMEDKVPLVIPEVNPESAFSHRGIIANPNCSTAITLMGVAPLHRKYGLTRLICSTYQAVSGAGASGITELDAGVRAYQNGTVAECNVFPHPIAFNLIPHVDRFFESGYTKEELKLRDESRKILDLPHLRVSCTCVRVPVYRAHSISVFAEFARDVNVKEARKVLANSPGVDCLDLPGENVYPMPLNFSGQENCAVGRIRKDEALDQGLAFWVVGDQLWKGAALNALQIAELLIKEKA